MVNLCIYSYLSINWQFSIIHLLSIIYLFISTNFLSIVSVYLLLSIYVSVHQSSVIYHLSTYHLSLINLFMYQLSINQSIYIYLTYHKHLDPSISLSSLSYILPSSSVLKLLPLLSLPSFLGLGSSKQGSFRVCPVSPVLILKGLHHDRPALNLPF